MEEKIVIQHETINFEDKITRKRIHVLRKWTKKRFPPIRRELSQINLDRMKCKADYIRAMMEYDEIKNEYMLFKRKYDELNYEYRKRKNDYLLLKERYTKSDVSYKKGTKIIR